MSIEHSSTLVFVVHFAGEFRGIMGQDIPFRKLNFPSLDAFIETIPDTIRIGRFVAPVLETLNYNYRYVINMSITITTKFKVSLLIRFSPGMGISKGRKSCDLVNASYL